MTGLVLDASAAITAIEGVTPAARALFARLRTAELHAPHLIDAEVGHVLRRQVARGQLDAGKATGALRVMEHLVENRYPHISIAPAAWALRDSISYHDALYVALATRLGVPLLTADARLACSPGLPCAVEVIS